MKNKIKKEKKNNFKKVIKHRVIKFRCAYNNFFSKHFLFYIIKSIFLIIVALIAISIVNTPLSKNSNTDVQKAEKKETDNHKFTSKYNNKLFKIESLEKNNNNINKVTINYNKNKDKIIGIKGIKLNKDELKDFINGVNNLNKNNSNVLIDNIQIPTNSDKYLIINIKYNNIKNNSLIVK